MNKEFVNFHFFCSKSLICGKYGNNHLNLNIERDNRRCLFVFILLQLCGELFGELRGE